MRQARYVGGNRFEVFDDDEPDEPALPVFRREPEDLEDDPLAVDRFYEWKSWTFR